MSVLQWSDDLAVGVESMDATHREFVDRVNAAAEAPDEGFAEAFDALLAHTREHFAAEEALMEASGFFALSMHRCEHRRVLAEMEQMRAQVARGVSAMARAYLRESVPEWFPLHRNTMDMATASFLRAHGM